MIEPPAAALIRGFANTIDVEERTDVFDDAAATGGWLRDHGLLGESELSPADHERVLVLRSGLRERLLLANGGEADPAPIARAEALLARLPLHVVLGTGPEPAEPLRPAAGTGADAALATLAAAWASMVTTGDWRRLKQCPDHECGWVFWDATRSRTRRWCTMRVCGNRAKTRAYAERNRT